MITRTAFDVMTVLEKVNLLFDEGDELETRIQGDYRIILYLVADFFVELRISQSMSQPNILTSLSEGQVLERYYDRIDISDALN